MITREQIIKANKDLPTVNIKGKEYVMVKDRVKALREVFPDFSIMTEILNIDEESVTIRATIIDESGNIKATGHAHELKGASPINRTSYVENAETSAIGRAIGLLGIGIDDSFGSADEVANAMKQQADEKVSTREAKVLKMMMEKHNIEVKKVLEWIGASSVDEMTKEQYVTVSREIDKKYGQHSA